jgi:hypothetical protein
MTKIIYGHYHSVPCKFIVTNEQIQESEEAQKFLKSRKWDGLLRIYVKPVRIYKDDKGLYSDIIVYLEIDRTGIRLAYDGYEVVDYITEMQDIRKLSDIWAGSLFKDGFSNKEKHWRIDKRFMSKEDKENLRHLVILQVLEDSK